MTLRSPASLLGLVFLAACAGNRGPESAAGGARTGATPSTAVAAAAASEPAAAGCAAPLPGHPTPAEQRAFVGEIGPLAQRAERERGVPAAAVAAMAIQESGYGWTPLARSTNNLLAWKYVSAEAAGGRPSWVLVCPERGTRDGFVVFRDRGDAVAFVAEQLATSDNYRADTARYERDRAEGVPVRQAVDRWVEGVADPYSSQPNAYREAIARVLAEEDLYRLSEQVRPPRVSARLDLR